MNEKFFALPKERRQAILNDDLWEMLRQTPIDIEKMEHDFEEMIEFWKHLYLKETKTAKLF